MNDRKLCSGNVAAVPLINGLGMGPGMLIWGSVQV